MIFLLEWLIKVGQGLVPFVGLVSDPEKFACARFLLELDIHSVLVNHLGNRTFLFAGDGFEQAVVVIVFELPDFGADISGKTVVVVKTTYFGIV